MMQAITTPRAPGAFGPYSQAVFKNGMLFISGQLGFDPVTDIMPESFADQANLIINGLKEILKAAGMSLSHVVKVTVFLDDLDDFPMLNEIYAKHFTAPYPARETIQVARIPKNGKLEISLIAMK